MAPRVARPKHNEQVRVLRRQPLNAAALELLAALSHELDCVDLGHPAADHVQSGQRR
jgi:hypothetical protein